MASYSVALCKHATLSGTTVDTVTITDATTIDVCNDAAAGGTNLYVTVGIGTAPSDPTSGGDNTYMVPPGGWSTFAASSLFTGYGVSPGQYPDIVVKVLGNNNAYRVEGKP